MTGRDAGDELFRSGSLGGYAEYVDEFLRAQLAEADLDDALTRRFWDTIATAGPSCVGTWIDARFDELQVTHQAAADRLNVDRSAVTKWVNKGGISLSKFLGLFIRFRVIDLFPRLVDDVRVEGYLGAIAYVQDALKAQADGRPASPKPAARKWPWSLLASPSASHSPAGRLDRERYLCLARLFSSDSVRAWADAQARHDMPRLEAITNEVREDLRTRLGRPPRLGGVRDLEDLVREWGNAWLICHRVIDEGLFDENQAGKHDRFAVRSV